MKKISSLIFTVVIFLSILSIASFSAQAKSAPGNFVDKMTLLSKLGITEPVTEKEAKEKAVSRAEFAVYVGKILGADKQAESDIRYFVDVPMDHWANNTINNLTEMGVISVNSNKLYRPNDNITSNEALKILLTATGYESYANALGQYPYGYIAVADKVGLSVKGSENAMMLDEVICLIYDAIQIQIYEGKTFSESNISYDSSEDTILSRYFDIYKSEGIVTESEGIAVDGRATDKEACIRIGKTLYETDMNLMDYLGRNITFFYKQEKDETPKMIQINNGPNKEDVLEIDIKDFEEYNYKDSSVTYYDDKENERKARVSKSATVIKNGKIMDENIIEAFNVNKGSIRLIDSDENGEFDYILISDYVNYVVDSIDKNSDKVYDAVYSSHYVELDKTGNKVVIIRDSSGKKINFDDIKIGSILSVYESDVYVLAVMSGSSISGTVFSIGTDKQGECQLLIGKNEKDTQWYSIDKNYYQEYFKGSTDSNSININPGSQGTYYIDSKGNIAYIKFINGDTWILGYLVENGVKEGVDPTLELKIYNQKGEMNIYEVDNKTIVDGTVCKGKEAILSAIGKDKYNKILERDSAGNIVEDNVNGQVLRIKVNSENKIKAIDTENVISEKEGSLSLHRTEPVQTLFYRWDAGSFDGHFVINSSTVVFAVPEHKDLKTATDKDFAIPSSNWFVDYSYKVEGFKLDESAGFESTLVLYNGITYTPYLYDYYLIESVGTTIDSNGDEVKVIYAWLNGLEKRLLAEKGYEVAGADKGDIIRINKNLKGEVNAVEIVFDYSRRNDANYKITWNWHQSSTYTKYGNLAYGYVKSFKDGVIGLTWERPQMADYGPGEITKADYVAQKKAGAVTIFDSTKSGNNVYIGSDTDIIPANMVGDKATPYFLYTVSGVFKGAIFYR